MNEQEPIIVNTKYTYNEYLKLNQFNMYKKNKTVTISIIMCTILMIIADVILIFVKEYYLFTILTIALLIYLIFVKFWPTIIAKKKYKKDKELRKIYDNTFSFDKERVVITNEQDTIELKYINIPQIYETDDNLYIYTNKSIVHIVSKSKLTLKTRDKLRNMLKRYLKDKFIEI